MTGIRFNVRITLSDRDPFPSLQDFISGRSTSLHAQTHTESPITATLLSLDELEETIISPLRSLGNVKIKEHSLAVNSIERIEIRLVSIQGEYPSIFDDIGPFEFTGVDVSHVLVKDVPPWGPKIGPEERPESIPIDLLYDRLVTSEPIREASRKLFRDRHFARAVEEAFKCLNNAVRDKAGLQGIDNRELMQKTFSAKTPALRLNEGKTDSDWNEQLGYMEIYAGAMSGIRNPRAHEHGLTDKPAEALEMLTLANHLMRKLELAYRVGKESP